MDSYTIIQVSAGIYWGFQYEIADYRLISMSHKEIILELKDTMKTFFNIYNLKELEEGVNNLHLGFHQELIPGKVIFACDHCKDEK